MPNHIYAQHASGDRVEIVFPNRDDWQPAVVVRRGPPVFRVRSDDGREWFMTNTYRIRPAAPSDVRD